MEKKTRIHTVDALRGFALLGILYVHTIQYFLADAPNEEVLNTAIQNSFDALLSPSAYWLVLSKFYSIFSMLFGLSFYIQMRNGQAKHSNFDIRFFWKLVLLAGFAIVHRMIFHGDILMVYAVAGMLLIPFSRLKNGTLFIIAAALLAGAGRALYMLLYGTGQIFEIDYMLNYNAYMDAVLRGGFLDVVSANLESYPSFWNEQFGLWGRFYSTLGYFLLGLLIGRLSILENIEKNLRSIKYLFVAALVCTLAGFGLHIKYIGSAWEIFYLPVEGWNWLVVYGIYELFCVSMSFVYATGFILLAHSYKNASIFRYLGAYGRTGLTSYVSQSIIGTFIFFNWGLGLIHEINASWNLLIFLLILLAQIAFSYSWLQKFRYGPLEWLWRSLTYFQWVSNRKNRV